MRLILAVSALPLLVSAAPEATRRSVDDVTGGRVCAKVEPRMAGPQVRLFNDLEADAVFDLHHAVVRDVDGCIVPAIVRRDVDGRGDATPRSNGLDEGETPRRDGPTLLRPL